MGDFFSLSFFCVTAVSTVCIGKIYVYWFDYDFWRIPAVWLFNHHHLFSLVTSAFIRRLWIDKISFCWILLCNLFHVTHDFVVLHALFFCEIITRLRRSSSMKWNVTKILFRIIMTWYFPQQQQPSSTSSSYI